MRDRRWSRASSQPPDRIREGSRPGARTDPAGGLVRVEMVPFVGTLGRGAVDAVGVIGRVANLFRRNTAMARAARFIPEVVELVAENRFHYVAGRVEEQRDGGRRAWSRGRSCRRPPPGSRSLPADAGSPRQGPAPASLRSLCAAEAPPDVACAPAAPIGPGPGMGHRPRSSPSSRSWRRAIRSCPRTAPQRSRNRSHCVSQTSPWIAKNPEASMPTRKRPPFEDLVQRAAAQAAQGHHQEEPASGAQPRLPVRRTSRAKMAGTKPPTKCTTRSK